MISALSGLRSVASTRRRQPADGDRRDRGDRRRDFGKVLADVANNTVDAIKAGESAAIGGINGSRSVQSGGRRHAQRRAGAADRRSRSATSWFPPIRKSAG